MWGRDLGRRIPYKELVLPALLWGTALVPSNCYKILYTGQPDGCVNGLFLHQRFKARSKLSRKAKAANAAQLDRQRQVQEALDR